MNYFAVPDFDMEDDQHLFSTSSSITHHTSVDEEMMELLWQDDQVVAQPQQQERKSQSSSTTLAPTTQQYQQHQQQHEQQQRQRQQQQPQQQHLYMAEDEMANWLHYPTTEDLYSDLLCDSSQQTSQLAPAAPAVRQPRMNRPLVAVPPPSSVVAPPMNFLLFSRMRGKGKEVRPESMTVVGSSNTAATTTTNMRSVGEVSSAFPSSVGGEALVEPAGGGSGNTTLSSSSGTSGGGCPANTAAPSATAFDETGEKVVKSDTEDRKRKRTLSDDSNAAPIAAANQDVELEADDDGKKHCRGSHSSKRSRAAEVHNLSERRRRDRINEKMKSLQELIPRCNKSDKASMLDEVIEYLKSLKMQVQMMTMGCGMMPMMYPGMHQQFMPQMGMGMGMDMGMNRPMMPFPPNIPGSTFPTTPTTPTVAAAAAAQFAPNFSIPSVRMPSVPGPSGSNFSVSQSSIQADSVRSSYPVPTPGMPQMPNLSEPYQQFMALQQMQMQKQMQMQMQMQAAQNQSSQPGSSKPSTGKSETQTGPSTSKSEAEDDQ